MAEDWKKIIDEACSMLPDKWFEGLTDEAKPKRMAQMLLKVAKQNQKLKERDLVGRLPQRVKDHVNEMAAGYNMSAEKVILNLIHREYRTYVRENPGATKGATMTKGEWEASGSGML